MSATKTWNKYIHIDPQNYNIFAVDSWVVLMSFLLFDKFCSKNSIWLNTDEML